MATVSRPRFCDVTSPNVYLVRRGAGGRAKPRNDVHHSNHYTTSSNMERRPQQSAHVLIRSRREFGIFARSVHTTNLFYMVVMLLNLDLLSDLLLSVFHRPSLIYSFSANPSPFSSSGLIPRIPQTVYRYF